MTTTSQPDDAVHDGAGSSAAAPSAAAPRKAVNRLAMVVLGHAATEDVVAVTETRIADETETVVVEKTVVKADADTEVPARTVAAGTPITETAAAEEPETAAPADTETDPPTAEDVVPDAPVEAAVDAPTTEMPAVVPTAGGETAAEAVTAESDSAADTVIDDEVHEDAATEAPTETAADTGIEGDDTRTTEMPAVVAPVATADDAAPEPVDAAPVDTERADETPVSEAPEPEDPADETPTEESPTVEAPAVGTETAAPDTEDSTVENPVTVVPGTSNPTAEMPTVQTPPAPDRSARAQPTAETPSDDTPAAQVEDSPVTMLPVLAAPTDDAVTHEFPAAGTPAADTRSDAAPATGTPADPGQPDGTPIGPLAVHTPDDGAPDTSEPSTTEPETGEPAATGPVPTTEIHPEAAPAPAALDDTRTTNTGVERPEGTGSADTGSSGTGASGTTRTDTPPPLAPGAIRRAPALDGLRGIAVTSVVVYHLFGDVMRGGYLGVDIFFVLSGFLITSLLVREFGAHGRISMAEFWKRRLRRIVPAAATVLVVGTAAAGLMGGDAAVKLPQQFFTSLFFVNNWGQIAESQSYFAHTTPRIFMHYWSLAIEEQFYVVYPLLFTLLMLLTRRLRVRRRMLFSAAVTGLLMIASMAAMVWLYDPDVDPSRVYFGSETHAFGLLAGVTLALIATAPDPTAVDSWPQSRGDRTTRILGWTLAPAAFVGLIVLLFVLPDTAPIAYRGGLFLACLLTVVVVHNAIRENGPIPQLLRTTPLPWLGARSFSLYLWHWPVVVFIGQWLGGPKSNVSVWIIGGISLVISLALSELSYRWIETPFRRLGLRGVLARIAETTRRGAPAALLTVTLVVTMLAGAALQSSPSQSAQELELERQAALLKKTQADAAAAAAEARTRPASELPPGTDITAVGDSVMLAAAQALLTRFPGMFIDAEVSRHYSGGEPVIQALRAKRELREYLVLGFGTNGQAFPGQFHRIMRMAGPKRKVIAVVPYGLVDGIPQAAQQLITFASRYPNLYLAPWCSTAAKNLRLLGPDGVHPQGRGTALYADAVAAGLKQAVAGKRDKSITCPL
ncbi:MAG: acyltransferase family protein [Gordonia sp. (in: high G+C Gram-positive bacteria)]|uniref:acyltransferase family protein n=1 Tax=Gordonia sp. (in: high G+C Gram-positive bacteria) TaxID=84139 RepID=UPI0039E5167D